MTFRQEKIVFFRWIFFKVYLEIQENRLEAVSERFRQSKHSKLRAQKNYVHFRTQSYPTSSCRETLALVAVQKTTLGLVWELVSFRVTSWSCLALYDMTRNDTGCVRLL